LGGTITVLYQNGSPALNQNVSATWNNMVLGAIQDPLQPTIVSSATTNAAGIAQFTNWPGGSQAVSLVITSPYGNRTTAQVNSVNGITTATVTVYWNPLASVSSNLSTGLQKLGSFLVGVIILVIFIGAGYLIYRYVMSGKAAEHAEKLTSAATKLGALLAL